MTHQERHKLKKIIDDWNHRSRRCWFRGFKQYSRALKQAARELQEKIAP